MLFVRCLLLCAGGTWHYFFIYGLPYSLLCSPPLDTCLPLVLLTGCDAYAADMLVGTLLPLPPPTMDNTHLVHHLQHMPLFLVSAGLPVVVTVLPV
jgi:hypothetical protein